MGNGHELSAPERDQARSALIRGELDRILSSPAFAHSDRLCQFLRFIVETALREGPEGIKETRIGVQVYGRAVGYDPKTDSIVRTEARRLRLKLEEYYEGPGQYDRVRITVPTGGYAPQFEIRSEAAPQLAVVAEPLPPPRPASSLVFRTAWVAIALLLGTAFGILWHWFAYRRPPSTPPPHTMPVTRYPGYEFQPSLSRDGQRVAFVWNGAEDNYNLYVKELEAGDSLRLTSDPAYDLNPTWSPDGGQIAFLRLFPDGAKQIRTVPAAGGPERLLYISHAAQPVWVQEAPLLGPLPGPAWSPDGQYLAVSDHAKTQEPDSLYLVSIQTGEKKRLTSPRATELGDYYPAFSPDGRALAFVRIFNERRSSDLYVQSLPNGAARRITFDSRVITGLTWASGDRLVFSSNRLGDSLLWSVSPRGGAPELVAGAGHNVSQPTASANGHTLVYAEQFRNTNIWRVPIGGRSPTPPVKLIASSTENDSAQYSPDGQRIVFFSDRSGVPALWTCQADGSHPVTLWAAGGAPVGTPRWSPDGRQIVFDTVRKGRSVIALLPATGGSPRLLVSRESDAMMPSWSRDGQSIYFVSPTGSEEVQIWKQPIAGGPAIQVTREGGGEAAESPDGKTLYYLRRSLGIWQVPVSGGTEAPVPGLRHMDTSRYFVVASKGIYCLASENPPWTVQFYDFATRRISPVATIPHPPEFRTPSLSVSPDERWLLYTQLDQAGEDLMALTDARF